MKYLLFTYPNCQKCDGLKSYLQGSELGGEEYNLTRREGKLKIRDYLKVIKRDEKGGIILPTLVIEQENEVLAVVNDQEELTDWLRSRG
jgi:glutaredoxin